MTLLAALSQVPDFRQSRGRRHELSLVLACILLGTLSGAISWRDFDAFIRRHRAALLEHLQPPHGRLPSYSTLRRVLQGLDYEALQAAFLLWARSRIQVEEGEWWAVDGKSLGGVSAPERFSPQQNFKAVVSLYAHKRGIVRQSRAYENAKQSEIHLVQAMLEEMGEAEMAGAGVSADALHCTKKHAL
jgi:hypothetical protein